MTKIVTILTDGFADWETALLNAVGRSYYNIETVYAAPQGKPVVSSGGLSVTPALAISDIDLDSVDALVVCGGTAWQQPGAPDLSALLQMAKQKGKVIGLICDATIAAAKAGVLDDVAHTSNGAGDLDATGYAGQPLYRETASAVVDKGIVTAAGTSPVAFAQTFLKALGVEDEGLDYYIGLHQAQFRAAA